MKVDIEDILFWMDAIRNSEDRYRTLESFWKGQIRSKIWLIESLRNYLPSEELKIVIHGGWNGVLASLMFNSDIDIKELISIDIDPSCEAIASTINKRQEMQGRFKAVTADMCQYLYDADVVINTSCEHITQSQYETWLSNVPDSALIVLQTNNYYELDEHIRCSKDQQEFIDQSKICPLWVGSLELPKYTRFMLIGRKYA